MKHIKLFENFAETNGEQDLRRIIKGTFIPSDKDRETGKITPAILGEADVEQFINTLDGKEMDHNTATVLLLQACQYGRVDIVKHLLSIYSDYTQDDIDTALAYTNNTRFHDQTLLKDKLVSILTQY